MKRTYRETKIEEIFIPHHALNHVDFIYHLANSGLCEIVLNKSAQCIHVISNKITDYYFNHVMIFSNNHKKIMQGIVDDQSMRGGLVDFIEIYTSNTGNPLPVETPPNYYYQSNSYLYSFPYESIKSKTTTIGGFNYRKTKNKNDIRLWVEMQNGYHEYSEDEINLLVDTFSMASDNKMDLYLIYFLGEICGSVAIYTTNYNYNYTCCAVIDKNHRELGGSMAILNLFEEELFSTPPTPISLVANHQFNQLLKNIVTGPQGLTMNFVKKQPLLIDYKNETEK